jgi:hypothetical protein
MKTRAKFNLSNVDVEGVKCENVLIEYEHEATVREYLSSLKAMKWLINELPELLKQLTKII